MLDTLDARLLQAHGGLDAGMLAQPGGQGLRLPVGQHVDRPVGVHVDQDRVVGAAAADREVVDAEHPHRRNLGLRLRADQPDQHVTATRIPSEHDPRVPGHVHRVNVLPCHQAPHSPVGE
jgi:hypothetical protein